MNQVTNVKHEVAERIWRTDGPGTFQHVWTANVNGRDYYYGEVTDSAEVDPELEALAMETFLRARVRSS